LQTQNALNFFDQNVSKKDDVIGVERGILDEIGTFLLYIGCKEWKSICRTNNLRAQNIERVGQTHTEGRYYQRLKYTL
jgi:hypothetical protein